MNTNFLNRTSLLFIFLLISFRIGNTFSDIDIAPVQTATGFYRVGLHFGREQKHVLTTEVMTEHRGVIGTNSRPF